MIKSLLALITKKVEVASPKNPTLPPKKDYSEELLQMREAQAELSHYYVETYLKNMQRS